MINRDGKLFGKVSIIDIVVVVLVIVLALGIYKMFVGGSSAVVTSSEKVECTLIIKNVRSYTADALAKKGPLYDKVSKEYIGEITDVKVEDGLYQVNMVDGSFKQAVPEDRYNVYVTVEFSGKASENGYYTAANKYLGAGTSVGVTSKYAECESTVYSISGIE